MSNQIPIQPLRERIVPAKGYINPPGMTNFPVKLPETAPTPLNELQQIKQLLANLMDQNAARTPILRGRDVTDVGQTMDFSMFGDMARVMIRNAGPDSVWMSFNEDGRNTPTTTGDGSFEIQAQEAVSITNCQFQKIGLRCATGDTGKVHAIAFQKSFGDFGGAIV